jgi:hypothetical protein
METLDPNQNPFVVDGIPGEVVFRNPSTGEIINTPEKYAADIKNMEERAKTEEAAGIVPKAIDDILREP